jgi:hypothetical protein
LSRYLTGYWSIRLTEARHQSGSAFRNRSQRDIVGGNLKPKPESATMGDIVDLRKPPISSEGEFNAELVTDLARFSEGLVSEKDIKRRYRFDAAVWESLGENEALFAAIEDEKTRRIRSGALKRERAQVLVTSAPGVLGEILLDKNASPKHRLDSAKALDSFAVGSDGAGAPAADRF